MNIKKFCGVVIVILVVIISYASMNKINKSKTNTKETNVVKNHLVKLKNYHQKYSEKINKLKKVTYNIVDGKKVFPYINVNFNQMDDQKYYRNITSMIMLISQDGTNSKEDNILYKKMSLELIEAMK